VPRSSAAAWFFAALSLSACAQPFGRPPALRGVGIDQKLNAQVPLDLTFVDEFGNTVRLRDFFNGKPVILTPVYYQCPMLCNLVLNGLLSSMRQISLDLGKDFQVISVSFDPRETPLMAARKKQSYIEKYGRDGAAAGWHFLTGHPPEIKALTEAVGFHYQWDPALQQWAHASGIILLTPDGRVSRYFYGINYEKHDLRLGLVDSSNRKIGTPVDQILLFCYHYDPTRGKYSFVIFNALRIGGAATAVLLGMFLFVSLRRERKGARKA
jgi:protein SCO1/2